ncbi:MAG TPA: hypothetical protein V6D34_06475 [Candidatus Sericytochromatia bacterium]
MYISKTTSLPSPNVPISRYGTWETVSGRFYAWRKRGLWQQMLAQWQQQSDAAASWTESSTLSMAV